MEVKINSTDEVEKTINTSPAHPLALESTVLIQNNGTENQNISSHQNGGSISFHSQDTLPITSKPASGLTYPTLNSVTGSIPSINQRASTTPNHYHTIGCSSAACMTNLFLVHQMPPSSKRIRLNLIRNKSSLPAMVVRRTTSQPKVVFVINASLATIMNSVRSVMPLMSPRFSILRST